MTDVGDEQPSERRETNSVLMQYFSPMFKTKPPSQESPLKRCLTTWDLTSLGVGAVLGAGVYVVAGQVASLIAGPSVIISFAIAAFASLLSGLAYAEFGARVPHTTGGAYAYSYVAVGEVWAFFIGWNLILEYMIGTAADASALSASLEHIGVGIFGSNVSNYFAPFDPILGDARPDLVASLLTVAVTFLLAVGCKDSARFSAFCNVINVLVIVLIVVVGAFFADPSRWAGFDRFFPFGISGTLSGAASCFYAFVGFDIIATTGEEAANPSSAIPKAVVYTLAFVMCCYIAVSSVVTMITDYSRLGERAPIVKAFEGAGVPKAGHIVSLGAVFGIASSLLGSMFPLPRIIFAMATDRLIHPFFSRVQPHSGVPLIATIVPGILTALFALVFDLKELVEMMSIGTLLAYSLVSLCVLVLRYQPTTPAQDDITPRTFRIAMSSLAVCIFAALSLSILLLFAPTNPNTGIFHWWSILLMGIFGMIFVGFFFVLRAQPQSNTDIPFKAPFVPALPLAAIAINSTLMMKLSSVTWVRFFVWMVAGNTNDLYTYSSHIALLGIVIYFGYSIRNSRHAANS